MQTNINPNFIIEALKIIYIPNSLPQQIHSANNYLTSLQNNSKLPLVLLNIYAQAQDHSSQMATILFFSNWIKRNWKSRGRQTAQFQTQKSSIKIAILQTCQMHDMVHVKHFNALLKAMTRFQYPTSYLQLHLMIKNWISTISNMASENYQNLINAKLIEPMLSTIKIVLKEYNSKKICHNQNDFNQFMTDIIAESSKLSQNLRIIINDQLGKNIGSAVKLFQYLRKADKISLYALSTMPNAYQTKPQIGQFLKNIIGRIHEYNNILGMTGITKQLKITLQKYLIGTIELCSKLQQSFPFLITTYLKNYLQMYHNMLLIQIPTHKFQSQKLISTIIAATYRPLLTFAYYMDSNEFKQSIYSKKSNVPIDQLQNTCHIQFLSFFNQQTVPQILTTILSQVMLSNQILKSQKQNYQQLVLEDTEVSLIDQVAETTLFEDCITYCRSIIRCFKHHTKPVILNMINQIKKLGQLGKKQGYIVGNIVQILLILPQIYVAEELPVQQIYSLFDFLLQRCRCYDLCRLVRRYNRFFNQQILIQLFSIMINIASVPLSSNNTLQIVYRAALAIKTLINQCQMQIPEHIYYNLQPCIKNIISIFDSSQFTKNPTLLWPIISLIVSLLKNIPKSPILNRLCILVNQGIHKLAQIERNQQLIISALCELVSNLLYLCFYDLTQSFYPLKIPSNPIDPNTLPIYSTAISIIFNNLKNKQLQNHDTIYKLWLTFLRYYPSLSQQQLLSLNLTNLNHQIKSLFDNNHGQIQEDNQPIFLQIIQQNLIIGILQLQPNQLLQLIKKQIYQTDLEQSRPRLVFAAVHLYYTYAILHSHVPQILLVFLKQLMDCSKRVSPPFNSLRTYIFLVFAYHLYNLFTNYCGGNYIDWFHPFISAFPYCSNKFAFKLNTAAFIKTTIDISPQNMAKMLLTQKQGSYPIDDMLKNIAVQLGVSQMSSVCRTYDSIVKQTLPHDISPSYAMSVKQRKTQLHLFNPTIISIIQTDLTNPLRQCLANIIKIIDWDMSDINQRVDSKLANKLGVLLGYIPLQQSQ